MGDLGLIPGLGRSPGEGNVYPLQYSCLENPQGTQRALAPLDSPLVLNDFWYFQSALYPSKAILCQAHRFHSVLVKNSLLLTTIFYTDFLTFPDISTSF